MKSFMEKHIQTICEAIGSEEKQPVRSHEFVIEEQYEWIVFQLDVTRRRWFTMLVWDPNGALRVQFLFGKAPNQIILHREPGQSSPLTVPGELPLGKWKIKLVTVEPKRDLEYRLEIECGKGRQMNQTDALHLGSQLWALPEKGSALVFNQYDWHKRLKSERRWYKGDFHTHTILSDGKMTQEANMLQAEKMDLDFFVTTEHHIMATGWVPGNTLVIPGVEITSSRGHCNLLGPKQWMDWRYTASDGGMETEVGMNRILREAKEAGAIRSVNHPMLKPWHWWFQDTDLEQIDVMEIWNDPTYPANPEATETALKLWNTLWNDGYQIWGIGGSDSHLTPEESYTDKGEPSLIGDPGTFVFADGLSAEAILASVSKGRVYVSRGPRLNPTIIIGKSTKMLGDDVRDALCELEDGKVDFLVDLINAPNKGSLHWIENGQEVSVQTIDGQGHFQYTFYWGPDSYNWGRLEVRPEEGKLLAFTNPVYSGKRERSLKIWSQLLEKAGVSNVE